LQISGCSQKLHFMFVRLNYQRFGREFLASLGNRPEFIPSNYPTPFFEMNVNGCQPRP